MARKPKQASESTKVAAENVQQKPPPFIEVTNQEQIEVEYRSRCGGALRNAREKLGLSTQEIASRLRLSYKQIEALEADNFAVLPEATIVKGFIRNYAKQLKIDAEPLLDAYSVIMPSKAPQSFTLQPSVNMKVTEYQKPNIMRNTLLSVMAVLAVGIWLFYQNYVQKPSPVNPSAELTQISPAELLPEAALPAAERSAEPTTTQLTLPAAADVASATPTPAAPVASNLPPTSLSTNPLAPSQLDKNMTLPIPPAAGMAKLEFVATQETWVNVTDANGREIYSKTLFGGNRESMEVKPPANITVGNSLGTSLSVNGKVVDLAPHTRTNVAHVKVE